MIRRVHEMRTEVRDKMRGGEGSVTIRHYFEKNEFGATVRLCARLILPPGAGIGNHPHEGEDEVYIVTRGSGTLTDSGVDKPIAEGDAILTGKGASHAVKNTGKEDLEMIAVIMSYPVARD